MEEITSLATSTKIEFKVSSLVFVPLHSNGANFIKWTLDAQVYLSAENTAKTLDFEDTSVQEDLHPATRWHALMILQRHLDATLQI